MGICTYFTSCKYSIGLHFVLAILFSIGTVESDQVAVSYYETAT